MKGLLILSNHVEDVEALATLALLKRAGIEMVTGTFEQQLTITTAFGLQVQVDAFMNDLSSEMFDFLVIPGGPYVSQTIHQNNVIGQWAIAFHQKDKWVAAICAAPRFLGRIGLLDQKAFTAYPGSESDMPKGDYLPEHKVVKDGRIITARGAGVVYDFVFEIVQSLCGEETLKTLRHSIVY